MLIVQVYLHVKPECIEAFKALCRDNSDHSRQEPGIARFDVLQQQDDPTRFILLEAYRTPDAPAKHKETAHYARWRDAVGELLAEPRYSLKFSNVCPGDEAW